MSEGAPAIPDPGLPLPQEIIRRKRDGAVLREAEIDALVQGLVSGAVGGEQAAAFAMAVFFKGMSSGESTALTRAMARSGNMLDWRALAIPGPVLDKHSTGGIGDNVSLVLAPILAACGAFVPMISGRGLGHTGGTLDKLDAIPGYRSQVSMDDLRRCVTRAGCAIVGAGADLAPADARLYAIRDVTATVDSIPLIVASILSKKLAAGVGALVMDVKTGAGAFMTELDAARDLAQNLVAVASACGLPTAALVTDMDQPLADAAGNAIEVRHAIGVLTGGVAVGRLGAVVTALGATLLVLGGLASDEVSARRAIADALSSGAAAERFGAMVAALGGPADLLDHPDRHLVPAPVQRDVVGDRAGYAGGIDPRAIGLAVVRLGGGRTRPGEAIDARVGFSGLAPLGREVGPSGAPLGMVHARTPAEADAAAAALLAAYRITDEAPAVRDPVIDRLGTGTHHE